MTFAEKGLINKMQNVFNEGFKFAIKLDILTKERNFVKENFENLNKIEIYFNEINEIGNSFLILVNFFLHFFNNTIIFSLKKIKK
jgi:hypothetical protein